MSSRANAAFMTPPSSATPTVPPIERKNCSAPVTSPMRVGNCDCSEMVNSGIVMPTPAPTVIIASTTSELGVSTPRRDSMNMPIAASPIPTSPNTL